MKPLFILFMLMAPVMAFAAGPTVGPISDAPNVPNGALDWCEVGNPFYENNLNGYAASYQGGVESYAVLMDPTSCPTCDLGFYLTTNYLWIQWDTDGYLDFTVSVAEAVDMGNGCYSPGAMINTSPEFQAGPFGTGGWYVYFDWNPGCMDPGQRYFYVFTITTPSVGFQGPQIDNDGITPCLGYRNDGSGWVDLADLGFPGDIILSSEADCCSEPVSTDPTTWDSLKSSFR